METKRLLKSRKDRKICGVCGGIAQYLNVDSTVIRLLMVLVGLTFVGVLFYIIAAIIMPEV